MTAPTKYLIVFMIILLTSCTTTTTTNVKDLVSKDILNKFPSLTSRVDLRVALITTDDFETATLNSTIYSYCVEDVDFKPKQTVATKKGTISAINTTGNVNKLVFSVLSDIFTKIDVYKHVSDIKNKDDYDYLVIPDTVYSTSYDKEQAAKRTIGKKFNFKDGKWFADIPYNIAIKVVVEYNLKVIDIKNGETIARWVGKDSASSFTSAVMCDDAKKRVRDRYFSTAHLSIDYAKCIGYASLGAFKDLLNNAEPKLLQLARTKSEEHTLPSELSLSANFSDMESISPNNTLDAGEEAEIIITAKNTGNGTGYATNLEITSDNSKISFDRSINIGDIAPGGTKEIKVNLKTGLDIADGKAAFTLNLKEKRGYDPKKVIINVPTARLMKPQLEIVSTEINDGDSGLAKGNGNGIPESGETIELTAFIKNRGEGKAIGVNLNGEKMTPGIQWVRDSTLIGTISPGEIAKAKIAFSIPRNFDSKDILSVLKAGDMRGVSNAEKNMTIAYAKRSPDIRYVWRILSKGIEVKSVTNGEEYEIELTVNNKGQVSARGVTMRMSSGMGINLSKSRIELGELKEQASAPVYRNAFSIPRTFADTSVPVTLEISQADFSPVKGSIQIPVDVRRPGLKYSTSLLSKNGGNSLEQGEQAVLEVLVINNGGLLAEGVKIAVMSKDANLQILNRNEINIGAIPPGTSGEPVRFQILAKNRLAVGPVNLAIDISQDEFESKREQYALNIIEGGATIIDVAGENRPKTTVAASPQAGPKINIIGLETATSVIEDETYPLAFEVADVKNISKITLLVNGRAVAIKEAANLALKAAKSKQIVQDIPLDEGENRIVITAYNSDNILSKKEFTITRAMEEDVDTPKYIGPRNPNAVAVVIGISKFKNDIPAVAYARRDAETVKEYLIKTLGYSEAKIKTFYDEDATVTELKKYFSKLRTKVAPGVTDVFLFYSGHGTPDTNTQEPYFVPYDFDPSDPATTGFAANDLYRQLGELGAKSATIVLDSCFSGKSSDGKQLVKGVSAGLLKSKDPFFGVKNGVLLTAATKEQPASWYEKKQHGLFTYYFLQGLQGSADHDKNGVITVDELSRHIQSKVSEQALVLHNREQTPEVKGDGAAVVVRYK